MLLLNYFALVFHIFLTFRKYCGIRDILSVIWQCCAWIKEFFFVRRAIKSVFCAIFDWSKSVIRKKKILFFPNNFAKIVFSSPNSQPWPLKVNCTKEMGSFIVFRCIGNCLLIMRWRMRERASSRTHTGILKVDLITNAVVNSIDLYAITYSTDRERLVKHFLCWIENLFGFALLAPCHAIFMFWNSFENAIFQFQLHWEPNMIWKKTNNKNKS